jgi:hypothetical protein
MKFKDKTRADKLIELEPKEKKFLKNDKGESLKAEQIKSKLLENRNIRLQMTVEEGADPLNSMTFKEQIEDIKYINNLPVSYFKQFEEDTAVTKE